MASLIGIESTRSEGVWIARSLLGIWLALVVLVVPGGAEEFSLWRCLGAGGQGGQIDLLRHHACIEAQRADQARRNAVERARQRQAEEERQAAAKTRAAADQAAADRARLEAERAEAVERSRQAEGVERSRRAAEDEAARYSLMRCLSEGAQAGQAGMLHHFACIEAQRADQLKRSQAAAERERKRRMEQEQQAQAQAKAAAEQADRDRARQEAERARQAEAVERARKAEAAERERKAAEEAAARRTEALQAAQRARRSEEPFMLGICPEPDLLTVKCATPQDPVLEQIRKSQENAARGRPSR